MNPEERIAFLERQLADAEESRRWDLVAAQGRMQSHEIAERARAAADARADRLEDILRSFYHAAERAVAAASSGRFSDEEIARYNAAAKIAQVAIGEDDE